MKTKKMKKSENGSSLIGAMFLMMILGFAAAGVVTMSTGNQNGSVHDIQNQQAFYVGQAGLEKAKFLITTLGQVPDTSTSYFGEGSYVTQTDPVTSLVTVTSTVGDATKTQTIGVDFAKDCTAFDTTNVVRDDGLSGYADDSDGGTDREVHGLMINNNCGIPIITQISITWNYDDCVLNADYAGGDDISNCPVTTGDDTLLHIHFGSTPVYDPDDDIGTSSCEDSGEIVCDDNSQPDDNSDDNSNDNSDDGSNDCNEQDENNGHGNDCDHDDDDNPGQGGGNHGADSNSSDGGSGEDGDHGSGDSNSEDNNDSGSGDNNDSGSGDNNDNEDDASCMDTVDYTATQNGQTEMYFRMSDSIPAGAIFTVTMTFSDGSTTSTTFQIQDDPGFTISNGRVVVEADHTMETEVLCSQLTSGGSSVPIKLKINDGSNSTWTSLWSYHAVSAGDSYSTSSGSSGASYALQAYAKKGSWSATYDSTNTTQIRTLINGDTAPVSYSAATSCLRPYMDSSGHIVLDGNQAIQLFEMNTNLTYNPTDPAANFQDLIMLYTIDD